MAPILVALVAALLLAGPGGHLEAGPGSAPARTPSPSRQAPSLEERDRTLDLLTSVDDGETAPAPLLPSLSGAPEAATSGGRRIVRALVAYSHTRYFLDGPHQRGITYEALRLLERHLNARRKDGELPISVVILPVTPDQLLPGLARGEGDIAAGPLPVTAGGRRLVDFTRPIATGIRQIVVTSRKAAPLARLEDLSGRVVWVRAASGVRRGLDALNARLSSAGRPPVIVREVEPELDDEDLLQMVDAGLVDVTVADDYLALFWTRIFHGLVPRPDLVVRRGGRIAWAVRKGEPELRAEVDAFVARTRRGTLIGNVLRDRYLGTTRWVRDALRDEDLGRFRETIAVFKKYADEYGFDWLLCVAQGYQESQLDQARRSPAGAVGVMQVRPSTARDPNVGVPDVDALDGNVHAGLKYLRFLVDTYFSDPAIDERNRLLFAFASYDAGPTRIDRIRNEAAREGLDPDVWFRNVEVVAAREIGLEPVRYVRNIFRYYVAYRLVLEQMETEEGGGASAERRIGAAG